MPKLTEREIVRQRFQWIDLSDYRLALKGIEDQRALEAQHMRMVMMRQKAEAEAMENGPGND